MNDPQTLASIASAVAAWAALGMMAAQAKDNRRTPPPAVPTGPRVIRKAARRQRRRGLRPVVVGGAAR